MIDSALMSYGGGPFGITPLGTAPVVFSEQLVPTLHSSNKIDGKSKTWVFDEETNGFEGMDDVHQRVLLLLSYELTEPSLVDDGYALKFETQVRTALRPLTDSRLIRVDAVEVTFGPNGNIYKRITFTRLDNGVQVAVNGTP